MPAAVEVAAYRIAVEAVTNAIRHADARTVPGADRRRRISWSSRSWTTATGCPAGSCAGTGLESMEARATELGGSLRIEPRRGGGTRLEARLPLTGGRAPRHRAARRRAEGAGP